MILWMRAVAAHHLLRTTDAGFNEGAEMEWGPDRAGANVQQVLLSAKLTTYAFGDYDCIAVFASCHCWRVFAFVCVLLWSLV